MQNISTKIFAWKLGISAAFIYNIYLSTGDITILEKTPMPYSTHRKEIEFWEKLYKYNVTLPDSAKIVIHGIDFERTEFLKALNLLIPNDYDISKSEITQTLAIEYDSFKTVKAGDKRIKNLHSKYKNLFKQNEATFKAIYGDNISTVKDILWNKGSRGTNKQRDESMYNHVVNLRNKKKVEKIICIAGLSHTNNNRRKSLTGRFLKSKFFKNPINISTICKDCSFYRGVQFESYAGPYLYKNDTSLLDCLYANYYQEECSYTILPSDIIGNKKVTTFSNYIILLKE